MSQECEHPDAPETCSVCGAPVVATINTVGSCVEHLDQVFADAAAPLARLLIAANAIFADESEPG